MKKIFYFLMCIAALVTGTAVVESAPVVTGTCVVMAGLAVFKGELWSAEDDVY